MTVQELKVMKDRDIRSINHDELVDINDVVIDTDLPKEQRILNYLEQIKNPYCYKCGNVAVRVCFSEDSNAPTLEEKLISHFKALV